MYGQYMLTHNVNPQSQNNLPYYQQCYPNAMKYGLNKNNGTRQPEMPRIPTGKVTSSKPSEPTLRSNTSFGLTEQELARGTIMPADGPGATLMKKGKDHVKRIEILKPTLNKQIAKTRIFEKSSPSTRATSPDRESPAKRQRMPNEATLPRGVVTNLEEKYESIKPNPVPFNEAAFGGDHGFSHADFAIDEN